MSQVFLHDIESAIRDYKASGKPDLEDDLKNKLVVCLHKAILSGEYYYNDKVESVRRILNESSLAISSSPNLRRFIVRYFETFATLSLKVKDSLDLLLSGQENHLIDIVQFQDFYWKKELGDILADPENNIRNEALYRLNILLAYRDEYLECSEDILYELSSIESFLTSESHLSDSSETDLIKEILIDKVEFFRFKVKYRKTHPQENYREIMIDFPEIDADNRYFKFYESTIAHYTSFSNAATRKLSAQVYQSASSISSLKVQPFHDLKRHFYNKNNKGLEESKNNIDKLLNTLSDALKADVAGKKALIKFDETAFQSTINILTNSLFGLGLKIERKNQFSNIKTNIKSYLLNGKDDERQPKYLTEHYGKVKAFAFKNNGIHDYYCLFVFYEFIDEMIRELKSNPQSIIKVEEKKQDVPEADIRNRRMLEVINALEDLSRKVLDDLKDNLAKICSFKALPIYMTFGECLIDLKEGNDQMKLFLRSAYVLPIDYNLLKDKVTIWERLIGSQYNALRDTFDVAISNAEIKGQILDFDKKVKENEFKVVQIVAMFVSIATFVLINVKIFDNKTGMESFAIILGLAACFTLFNLFFHIIVIAQHKSSNKFWDVVKRFAIFVTFPTGLMLWSYSILSAPALNSADKLYLMENKLEAYAKKQSADSLTLLQFREKMELDSKNLETLKNRVRFLEQNKDESKSGQ